MEVKLNPDLLIDDQMVNEMTYSFHVFFCLQLFSIFICRITYEPVDAFRKTLGLFGIDTYGSEYDLDPTNDRNLTDFITAKERSSNRRWVWIQIIAISVAEILMLMYGRQTMNMKQIGLLSTWQILVPYLIGYGLLLWHTFWYLFGKSLFDLLNE